MARSLPALAPATILAVLASLALAGQAPAQERRELGAHVHGESRLDIAVEDGTIAMALNAPGMDIVGFEHAATTEAQKRSIAAATEKLEAPLALFDVGTAAGCTVESASATLTRAAAHDHDHDHDGHDHDHDAAEGGHAAFVATYRLACTNIAAIDRIAFGFFDAFPNAERVEVQLVSEKGQSTHEVTRAAPVLTLGGAL